MTTSRILVSQKDRALAHRTQALLRCAKYDVPAPVRSGREIRNIVADYRPDLVLMDVLSNDAQDALVTSRHIASRYDIPILCMAEDDDPEFLEQLEAVELVAYLLKPYEDRVLLANVRAALAYQSGFRKRMSRAARESEEWYKNAFEQAPIGKAMVGLDGRLLKVNKALGELTGYSERELTTKIFHEIIRPDNEKKSADPLGRVLKGGDRIHRTEGRCYHKLGNELRVLLNFAFVDDEPRTPRYFILQVLDITTRKIEEQALRESEQRYRKLVEATTSYIYTVQVENGSRKSTTHEQGCVFVTGYTSGEYDADPELWYKMVYEADRREVMKQAHAALSGKATPLEHRIVHKDGSLRWVRHSSVPHHDERGRLVTYDGLITCITEERKLKDQLYQAQKMETVGQLAGGIAHDFNNILTAIMSYASLLDMNVQENPESKLNVAQILSAAERAAMLTNRLLTFSRKQSINPMPVKINAVVQNVVKLLSRIIGEDIQLKHTLSERDLTVMADSWQLEQVLINLATNARDAMPHGGRLTIETGDTELSANAQKAHGFGEAGRYLCITVADTGIGMDEETQKRIFEPFFTTKEVGKGTGLGLAIVYGIVKQHNGYMNVISEPDKGAIFAIYLPVVSAPIEEKKQTSMIIPGGWETVLLAEDDEHVRLSTKSLLEKYGYRVVEASDGNDAISMFREHQKTVDLLILDVLMPKKTGKEAFEEIIKVNPDIKVIFSSGYTEELVRQKGILKKEENFVSKPIFPALFLRKIREVLDA